MRGIDWMRGAFTNQKTVDGLRDLISLLEDKDMLTVQRHYG